MKVLLVVLAFAVAGCSPEGGRADTSGPYATVPRDSISIFLNAVRSGDFHDMARVGDRVFDEGLRVPDHAELFAGLAVPEQRDDRVRYVFHRFEGEASVGEVSLTLTRGTGAVVTFTAVEAILE